MIIVYIIIPIALDAIESGNGLPPIKISVTSSNRPAFNIDSQRLSIHLYKCSRSSLTKNALISIPGKALTLSPVNSNSSSE